MMLHCVVVKVDPGSTFLPDSICAVVPLKLMRGLHFNATFVHKTGRLLEGDGMWSTARSRCHVHRKPNYLPYQMKTAARGRSSGNCKQRLLHLNIQPMLSFSWWGWSGSDWCQRKNRHIIRIEINRTNDLHTHAHTRTEAQLELCMVLATTWFGDARN